jgi:hypothetical protein
MTTFDPQEEPAGDARRLRPPRNQAWNSASRTASPLSRATAARDVWRRGDARPEGSSKSRVVCRYFVAVAVGIVAAS